MALFDDILSGGNWVTGLAIGVGAVVILPLATPILRPVAKTAIKGGILAYQGAAGLVQEIGDLVAEAAVEAGQRRRLRRNRRHTLHGGRSHLAVGLERKLDPDRGNLGQRGLPGFLVRAIGCKGSANPSSARGFLARMRRDC